MKAGDSIVMRVKTKRLAPSARSGVIEAVLDAGQPRLLVRWVDGRQTVIAPMPGSFRIEPAKPKRSATRRPKAASAGTGQPAKPASPAAKKKPRS